MIRLVKYAATMTLAAVVAVVGEPRPVALVVAGAAAATATFSIVKELEQ